MNHVCPVCRYPGLAESPRSPSGGASYEICPSCGYQFGVDDDDRHISYETWRSDWLQNGALWWSRSRPAPEGWDGRRQTGALPATVRKKREGED